MQIVATDTTAKVDPGSTIPYNQDNPLLRLLGLMEGSHLSADRSHYDHLSLDYLLPFKHLEFYGPSGGDADVLDPKVQDNKEDFQKQNVKSFQIGDSYFVRGIASLPNGWSGTFLKLSYDGGSDSALHKAAGGELGSMIRVWLKVGGVESNPPLMVIYNEDTDRYELEIWSYSGPDFRSQLDEMGQQAYDRGELMADPVLVKGTANAFARENVEGQNMLFVQTNHSLHPILPLKLEVAWANADLTVWDSNGGANYHYEFNMCVRGWNNFLQLGTSSNPHGGVGVLHYRNLLSNYFAFAQSGELGRSLEPWMFNASGNKQHPTPATEKFLAVDYMDLHILKPNCGIGLHRHRDNQELFFPLNGEGLMITGDWEKHPDRERAFELRFLTAGSFCLLKPGMLHALMNAAQQDLALFMFGGYD